MDSRPQRTIWIVVAVGGILQGIAALLVRGGTLGHGPGVVVQIVIVWVLIIALALLGTRRLERLTSRIVEHQQAHHLTLRQMEQLEAQNAVLQVITRTPDVTLAFQTLARRLARIVPCDRVGLALLKESGQEFQTYTARVAEEERRHRPRPELEFSMDRSVVGQAVRDREPIVIDVLEQAAPDFFDANVLHSGGFKSALIVPLMSKGRAVGTINLVSRQPKAFKLDDARALQSIAEILAVAYVAQQAQVALARFRTVEAMSDMTLSVANEINSALQIIIGHCDLLERNYAGDPSLQRDLVTVVRQAQRIAKLLDNMRSAAADRLREVAASVNDAGVPASPESLVEEDPT